MNMKQKGFFVALTLLSLVLFNGNGILTAQTDYVLRIKGVLVDRRGTPMKGKTLIVYPLDEKGVPIQASVIGKDGVVLRWNPRATTDDQGSFVLSMPRISKIGNDMISEASLSLKELPGGLVTVTVWKIEYVDPAKKAEMGLVRKEGKLPLLRRDKDILKIKLGEKANEMDLGNIVIE
jgi:hypothetical protein